MKNKLFLILLLFIISTTLHAQDDAAPINDEVAINAAENMSSSEKQLAETILLLEQKNAELVQLEIELAEVEESLGVVEGKNEIANTNYTQMMPIQKEIDGHQKNLNKINNDIEKANSDIASIEESISNIESAPTNLEEATEELNTYQGEQAELETKLSELENQSKNIDTQIKEAKKENPEADVSELNEQKTGLKNNIGETKSQISETKKLVSEANKKVKINERIIAASEKKLAKANSNLTLTQQKLEGLTTSKIETEAKISELQKQVDVYAVAINELEIDTSSSKKLSGEEIPSSSLVGKEKIKLSKREVKSLNRDITDRKIEIAELELHLAKLEYLADGSRVEIAEDNVNDVILEGVENPFLRYMKGKSRIGLNFAPNLSIYGFPMVLNTGLKYLIGQDMGFKAPSGSFSMTFSYDFAVLPFMALSFEAGFGFTGIHGKFTYTEESSGVSALANLKYDYSTIPYSFGLKFFPGQKAPFGFYILAKVGGTYVDIKSSMTVDDEYAGTIGDELPQPEHVSGHGIYAAIELGWHIQLFPTTGKHWPVQVGLDIGLFDVGYYFVPWATEVVELQGIDELASSFKWAFDIRAIFLPRLGVSIRF